MSVQNVQSVQQIDFTNFKKLQTQYSNQIFKSIHLTEEFKNDVKHFEKVPEGADDFTYLVKFYSILSGCCTPHENIVNMFASLPNCSEKLEKFMEFYKFARARTYDECQYERKLTAVLSHYIIQNNRTDCVNAWRDLVHVAFILFVDRVAECSHELIFAGDEWYEMIENIMKEIALNINDLYKPEGIRALMKDLKTLKILIIDLKDGKMNHFERIVLKYSFNQLLYKLYIHITFKPLTCANSIEISNFVRLSHAAGLITKAETARFEEYLNFAGQFVQGMDTRRKYKTIPLLLGYSNGLGFSGLYSLIYW